MKTQRIQFTEWMPDQPDIASGGFAGCENAIPGDNGYRAGYSWSLVKSFNAATAETTTRGVYSTRDFTGEGTTFIGTPSNLYEVTDDAGNSATSYNVSATGGYSQPFEDFVGFWDFTERDGTVFAANGIEEIQSRDITDRGNQFSTLAATGGPVTAKTIGAAKNFLIAGNIVDSDGTTPNRVRWPSITDPTDWVVSAATQADFQDLKVSGGSVQKIVGGEYAIVFQQRAVFRMTYVGVPLVWQFDEIAGANGTYHPLSVVRVGGDIYYYSRDGFRVILNGSQPVSIGEGKVDQWVTQYDAFAYKNSVKGAYDAERNIILWSFPSTIIAYDIARNKFGHIQGVDAASGLPYVTEFMLGNSGTLADPDDVVAVVYSDAISASTATISVYSNEGLTGDYNSSVESAKVELAPGRNALVTGVTAGRASNWSYEGSSQTSSLNVTVTGYETPYDRSGSTSSESVSGTPGVQVRRYSVRKNGRFHKVKIDWDGPLRQEKRFPDIVSWADVHYAESHKR